MENSERLNKFIASPSQHISKPAVVCSKVRSQQLTKNQTSAIAKVGAAFGDFEDLGDKIIGPCPACRLEGHDATGNHLVIFRSGAYACIRYPENSVGREDHLAQIRPFLSKTKKLSAADLERYKKQREHKLALLADIKALAEQSLQIIERDWSCEPAEWRASGASIASTPQGHFYQFCDILSENCEEGLKTWTGSVYSWKKEDGDYFIFDSKEKEKIWEEMQKSAWITHLVTWQFLPDAESRRASFAKGRWGLVVEFDNSAENPQYRKQVGLIRFLENVSGVPLAYAMHSGKKSIHAVFKVRGIEPARIRILAELAVALGADQASLSQCATRVPGAIRRETGKLQQLVFLPKK